MKSETKEKSKKVKNNRWQLINLMILLDIKKTHKHKHNNKQIGEYNEQIN